MLSLATAAMASKLTSAIVLVEDWNRFVSSFYPTNSVCERFVSSFYPTNPVVIGRILFTHNGFYITKMNTVQNIWILDFFVVGLMS